MRVIRVDRLDFEAMIQGLLTFWCSAPVPPIGARVSLTEYPGHRSINVEVLYHLRIPTTGIVAFQFRILSVSLDRTQQ